MLKVVHLGDLMNHVTTDQLQTTKPLISKVLEKGDQLLNQKQFGILKDSTEMVVCYLTETIKSSLDEGSSGSSILRFKKPLINCEP